jgi:ribosomal protein S18 acetylase RimI-like enzyme
VKLAVVKKLIIREIEENDIPAVLEIQTSIALNQTSAKAAQIVESQLKRPEGVGFVALLDSKVVGFLLGEIKRGDFGLEKSFWIINFGVSPAHMGEGIGHLLAERAFDVCAKQDITDICTTVRWDAGDVLSFFKSLGFDRSNFINLRKKL